MLTPRTMSKPYHVDRQAKTRPELLGQHTEINDRQGGDKVITEIDKKELGQRQSHDKRPEPTLQPVSAHQSRSQGTARNQRKRAYRTQYQP